MVIRQVAMARPGDAFLVVLTVSNSLDEHLQQTNTVGKSFQTSLVILFSMVFHMLTYIPDSAM